MSCRLKHDQSYIIAFLLKLLNIPQESKQITIIVVTNRSLRRDINLKM